MTSILAFSDLHLDTRARDRILDAAETADLVVGAGDFALRREGLAGFMASFDPIAAKSVFVCGNAESPEELRSATSARVLHGDVAEIAGLRVAGIGGAIPPLPKIPWASWDVTEDAAAELLDGIERADILVSHSPPHGIADRIASLGNRHMGSRAVRAAAERIAPRLLLCGHIHDCWGMSGQLGATDVHNLGPSPIWFEILTMPVEVVTILAFLPASLALNMTPGVDMLFCVAQGMRAGPRSALAASAGIAVGGIIHALIAALGFAALVAAFPDLLDVVRWVGVAYLLWLAWQSLSSEPGAFNPAGLSPGRAFIDGMFVNLANPKVLLFVLAFLPQFVDATRPVVPQFLILGGLLSFGGLIINGGIGTFAARAATRLAASQVAQVWLNRLTALIFVVLALWLAVSQVTR